MIKTQIQLPDSLYHEAKRVSRERELSLAEVIRRGVEYVTRVYPPLKAADIRAWQLPKTVRANLRRGVALEALRDLVAADEEPRLSTTRKASRRS